MPKALIIALESAFPARKEDRSVWSAIRSLMFPRTSVLIATCTGYFGERSGWEAELFCLDSAVRREYYRSGCLESVAVILERIIRQKLAEAAYELVFIVCPYTVMANNAVNSARFIRQFSPDSCIVTGGPHATFMAPQLVETGLFDAVVMGPGEAKIKHIIEYFNTPHRFSHPGICSRKKLRIFSEKALYNDCIIPPLDLSFIDPADFDSSYAGVIAGRGCMNNCSYCIEGRYWSKSRIPYYDAAEQVRLELLQFASKGIPVRGILDSQINLDCCRFPAFCENAVAGSAKIKSFFICTHINHVSREGCRIFRGCGGGALMVGMESASREILNGMRKKLPVFSEIKKKLSIIREEGLSTLGFFMFGYPGETAESCTATLNMIEELVSEGLLSFVEPSIFVPYPGLPIYENPRKYGLNPRIEAWGKWENWARDVIPPYDLETISGEDIYHCWQKAFDYFPESL